MTDFNLILHPWIPVRWLDGRHSLVGLDELFRNAADIADLDAVPHERISLIRLLVCITQAALGAPADYSGWDGFGGDLEVKVPAYLARAGIFPHFNLFGDGHRFLQCKATPGDKSYPACQVSFTMAAGNSPTLFDHYGESQRVMDPAFLARLLLCYQNFFVGGSMASKVKGNGPSLKMLHTFLTGENFKRTLLANCMDAELAPNFGKPYWELGAPDSIKGDAAKLATESYLGRLVPLSCRLDVTGNPQEGYAIHIDQGLEYPAYPAALEPSATVIPWKEELRLLRADTSRGIWRDLHCLAVLRRADSQQQSAPRILQSHIIEHEDGDVDLWVGELIKAKDAKILDGIEDRFSVPHRLFEETGRMIYANGVKLADTQSTGIYSAVKAYAESMMNGSASVELAQRHFWNSLDLQRQTLLDLVKDDAPIRGKNFGESDDPWSLAVREAAHAAYDHACPRSTPRQIEAYALGLRRLRPKSNKPKTSKTTPATP
ncbi:type I-E CRISPR-associated protein Cse1/CasA [bacterium]|nr:type I-E CRISPR-associated protein Cse1/CasA [bacterium]